VAISKTEREIASTGQTLWKVIEKMVFLPRFAMTKCQVAGTFSKGNFSQSRIISLLKVITFFIIPLKEYLSWHPVILV
jgi:hypothetical protein